MEAAVTDEIIARQPPEAQAIIPLLLARIAELEGEHAELLARIAVLEAKVDQLQREANCKAPQNSLLPPSMQHPHARPQPSKRKSKRKPRRQPGHQNHERPLIPTEQCDTVTTLTVRIQNQMAAAVRPCYEALAAQLPAQQRLSIDETATQQCNGKAWLWTFVTRRFTVFAVHATQRHQQLCAHAAFPVREIERLCAALHFPEKRLCEAARLSSFWMTARIFGASCQPRAIAEYSSRSI